MSKSSSKQTADWNDLSIYLTIDNKQQTKVIPKGFLNGKNIDPFLKTFLECDALSSKTIPDLIKSIYKDLKLSEKHFQLLENPKIKIQHHWGLTDIQAKEFLEFLVFMSKT